MPCRLPPLLIGLALLPGCDALLSGGAPPDQGQLPDIVDQAAASDLSPTDISLLRDHSDQGPLADSAADSAAAQPDLPAGADLASPPDLSPAADLAQPTCGDGTCDPAESFGSCAADCGFSHPGVGLGQAQLNFVKAQVAAGKEPWAGQVAKLKASALGKLSYVPHPVPLIKCGPYNSFDQGCTDSMNDALAAYTQSLIWSYTGDKAYATNAIKILDAWSSTLVGIVFDPAKVSTDPTQNNGPLQAAWLGEVFPRAAEILRHTNAGWSSAGIQQFADMLTNVLLPLTINGWTGGGANWLLSMVDATMSIGVFTNSPAVFLNGVGEFRAQVPAAIFMQGDDTSGYPNLVGAPLPPPGTWMDKPTVSADTMQTYWKGALSYISGLEGETCRDMSHMTMGFEGMAYAAETARIQGIDLYGEVQQRFTTALELNAAYINAALDGKPAPANWVCPDPIDLGGSGYKHGWEIAHNHYAGRKGLSLPHTKALVAKIRPTAAALHMAWETLTHFGTP